MYDITVISIKSKETAKNIAAMYTKNTFVNKINRDIEIISQRIDQINKSLEVNLFWSELKNQSKNIEQKFHIANASHAKKRLPKMWFKKSNTEICIDVNTAVHIAISK